ncbi:MAG: ATP-binding cassette domain-containing protein [Betaproteobacteria bacterium]|nr:ATP-binding cassette domain-containing protein [Betaproteobacteria bacterium]
MSRGALHSIGALLRRAAAVLYLPLAFLLAALGSLCAALGATLLAWGRRPSVPAVAGEAAGGAENSPAGPIHHLHQQMASAMVLAARSLGFSMSIEAVLSLLTDGHDLRQGADVLGYRQSGRRFGLNMDVVPAERVAGLAGMAPLIRIDLDDAANPVRLVVTSELGDRGSVLMFDDAGGARRDPDGEVLLAAVRGSAETARGSDGPRVIWLRCGRRLFSAQRMGVWAELLGQDKAGLNWLRQALLNERAVYRHAAMASVVLSVFGLTVPVFSMLIYNTIAPNDAMSTLTTLAIGVAVVLVFDFITQELRSSMVDRTARRLDVILSRTIFEQQLGMKLEHMQGAAGTQADMLRGYATVQEFFSSAVLLSVVELPFSLIALALVFYIGGWLGFISVLAIAAMIALNLILQRPMEQSSRLSMLHGQERHGTLVETIIAAEAVRAVGAERTMRRRWRDQVATSAVSSHQMRFYQQLASHTTSFIVQVSGVLILVFGAVLISDKSLTAGALVAAGMLNSRVMSPFAQLAGLLIRLYHTRTALTFLSRFMALPQVRQADHAYVSRPDLPGELAAQAVDFRYPAGPEKFVEALREVSLSFSAGERVAILGRNGSGKSTLLKILSGVATPAGGVIRVDGIDMQQIDPAEVRGLIGYVQQEPLLFSGTLRENLVAGWPHASDEELLRAAKISGVDEFARLHPEGYGMRLGERGAGLSTGQKQSVAIAQALIREPRVLLLDEPTSALDQTAEAQLLGTLREALKDRTVILVTHRPALLALVSRVVVLEAGRVVLDKPRDEALAILTGGIRADARADARAGSAALAGA